METSPRLGEQGDEEVPKRISSYRGNGYVKVVTGNIFTESDSIMKHFIKQFMYKCPTNIQANYNSQPHKRVIE